MARRGLERRLEGAVEGTFSRMFRGSLRPVELGKRVTREMDDHRSVGVTGETIVPNHFTIHLSEKDFAEFAQVGDSLRRELADMARNHARDEGYAFMGPLNVELVAEPDAKPGRFAVTALMRESEGGAAAGSLVLPTRERILLGEFIVSIGRLPECTITLADTNVSRTHAEIHPRGDGYVLVDLGSTNGSKVNGSRVSEHRLRDGDELVFGGTKIMFEAS